MLLFYYLLYLLSLYGASDAYAGASSNDDESGANDHLDYRVSEILWVILNNNIVEKKGEGVYVGKILKKKKQLFIKTLAVTPAMFMETYLNGN